MHADVPGAGSVEPADHPPLPFPEESWAWFVEACSRLGIPDPAPHRGVLEALHGHLIGVNRWLNLTRIADPRGYLKQHVLDSLAACVDSRLRHLPDGARCADLGSGGGYPGLPLALWHPRCIWALIDARRRKAEFLAAAARLSGVPQAVALHLRGGEAGRQALAAAWRRRCRLVVSRAMGAGEEVLVEAAQLLAPHGHLILYKGPAFAGEERERTLSACPALGYRFIAERTVVLEAGDPERILVVFERL